MVINFLLRSNFSPTPFKNSFVQISFFLRQDLTKSILGHPTLNTLCLFSPNLIILFAFKFAGSEYVKTLLLHALYFHQ